MSILTEKRALNWNHLPRETNPCASEQKRKLPNQMESVIMSKQQLYVYLYTDGHFVQCADIIDICH